MHCVHKGFFQIIIQGVYHATNNTKDARDSAATFIIWEGE